MRRNTKAYNHAQRLIEQREAVFMRSRMARMRSVPYLTAPVR